MNFWACMFIVIGVGAAIGMFVQSFFFSKSGEELTKRLRQLGFSAYMQQNVAFFDDSKNSTGALCARLATDASAVQGVSCL